MSFEMTGKIKVIMDEERFDSGFIKREFVITTEDQYPQDVKFELFKEKTELMNQFSPGDKVNVKFDIRGREWNDKYFVNLNAWRVEAAAGAAQASGGVEQAPMPTKAPIDLGADEGDDLPF